MSRELDALVEKHIFGKDPRCYDCPHFDEKGRMLSFCSCPEMPHRSTDIAAADPIIDRLAEQGYLVTIHNNGNAHEACWDVRFVMETPLCGKVGMAIENTRPMALCMAGLAALGIDVQAELKAMQPQDMEGAA